MVEMNIFDLAVKQVIREGKIRRKDWRLLVLDRAVTIRKWLDIQEKNKKTWKTRKLKYGNGFKKK
ncbi:MAG TPA: hypothetical protein ENG49_02760 [Candidatus Omnitrophica bacterium]|nr:hypothetical protein [Candidatus Omnitrophota bacterium]